MPKGMRLPPGATLVTDNPQDLKLPPGATLVTGDDAVDNRPSYPGWKAPNMEMSGLGKLHRIATDPGVIPSAIAAGAAEDEKAHPITVGAFKGIGKGALHTGISLSPLINKIPGIGETLAPSKGIANAERLATPNTPAQKVGYTGEQIAEWMLPTGLEGKAAGITGKLLANSPKIARAAIPAAKITTSALESGIRNKIQGGDFTTGAAAGGIGTASAPLLKKAASGLAEIAVAPGKRLLKSIPEGVDIGKTVLENSTGIKPSVIARQLSDKIANTGEVLNKAVDASDQAGRVGSITPARQQVTNELANAVEQNSPDYIKDVGKLRNQLRYQYGENGEPLMRAVTPPSKPGAGFMPVPIAAKPSSVPIELPNDLPAGKLRSLKRGVSNVIGNWNPESQGAGKALEKRVYGSINEPYHAIIGPEGTAADQALTSLIPAKDAAWNTSFNPSVARSMVARIARPTGALVGAGIGGTEGYKQGGIPGMVMGGAAGLAVPELIASPEGQMIIARGLTKPVVGRIAKGGLMQIARPSALDEDQPAQ